MKRNSRFKYTLALDCETTGVCMGHNDPLHNEQTGETHQAISWGFIVIDEDLEIVEKLYLEVKWNDVSKEQRNATPAFGTYAEKIHGLTLEALDENGIDEYDAVVEIANLIIKYWGTSSPINCLGHNVNFDIRFLSDLLRRYELPFRFSQRNVDTFGIGFTCWKTYNSDELFDLVVGKQRTEHNAMEDIEFTLKVVQTTRTLFQQMLD